MKKFELLFKDNSTSHVEIVDKDVKKFIGMFQRGGKIVINDDDMIPIAHIDFNDVMIIKEILDD